MKFCQLLQKAENSSDAVKDVGRFYKQYKKALKRLPLPAELESGQNYSEFAASITQEVFRWNEYFLDTEEDLVMKYSEIERRCKDIPDDSTTLDLGLAQQLVNVHGEIVLFMHWCMLAYTAVLKLLKKYHKRMSRALDAPHLSSLLSESFCSTEISSELLAGTEKQLARFAEHLGTRLRDPHSSMPFGHLGGGRDSTAIQMAVADLKTNLVNEAEDSNDEDDHDMDDNNSVGAANSGVNSGTDVTLAQGVQQQLQQLLHAQQQQAGQQQAGQQQAGQQQAAGAAGQQQQGMGARSPDAQQHSNPHGQQQAQQQASDAGQQQASDGMPGSHSMSHSVPGSGTGSVPMEEGPAGQHSAAQVAPPAATSPAPCSSQMQQEQQQQQVGGGGAMMVGELRAALNIWETLRDTAKTPSTVFNPALYAKH